jgi:hypothetical protein
MRIFSWLFNGTPDAIKVLLEPADDAAKTLPGFHTGGLALTASAGDTVGAVLAKFNQFRGPDSQIKIVYTQDGHAVPPATVLTHTVTLVVRKL